MRRTTFAFLFAAFFAFAPPVSAGVITWDFGGPADADLGGSETFSAGGVDVTADAFWVDDTSDSTFSGAFIVQTSDGCSSRLPNTTRRR